MYMYRRKYKKHRHDNTPFSINTQNIFNNICVYKVRGIHFFYLFVILATLKCLNYTSLYNNNLLYINYVNLA